MRLCWRICASRPVDAEPVIVVNTMATITSRLITPSELNILKRFATTLMISDPTV